MVQPANYPVPRAAPGVFQGKEKTTHAKNNTKTRDKQADARAPKPSDIWIEAIKHLGKKVEDFTAEDRGQVQKKLDALEALEALEDEFFTAASHKTGAEVLHYILEDYIFEPFDERGGGRYYRRQVDNVYFEQVLDMELVANSTLEAALNRAFDRKQAESDPTRIKDVYSLMGKALQKVRTRDFIAGVLHFYRKMIIVQGIEWNQTPETLVFLDSICDFSGSNLISRVPFESEHFKDPLPFKISDILNAKEPEKYNQFNKEIFPDPETWKTARFCRAGALSGLGKKSLVVCHNFFGNGAKNTDADIVRQTVGEDMAVFPSGSLITIKGDSGEKRFDVYRLKGSRFAFFDEVSGTFDVSAIKRFLSLSYIRGELKGQDSVTFLQTWVFYVLTNELLRFYPVDDSAFLNRLIVLVYETVFFESEQQKDQLLSRGAGPEHLFPARDKKEILAQMELERAGILRQMMLDAIILREKYGGKIPESKKCQAAKELYRTTNDVVERFITDSLKIDHFGSITNKRLVELYIEFAGDKKMTAQKLTSRITKKIPNLEHTRIGKSRGLKGIREWGETDDLPY